jgi:TolB-like protein
MHSTLQVGTVCAVLAGWLCSAAMASAQEAAARPTASDERQRVLVLPFESLSGEAHGDTALAHAIGRSLVVDLSRGRNFHAIEGEKVAADRTAALEAGKAEGTRSGAPCNGWKVESELPARCWT